MQAYLDNAATTKISTNSLEKYVQVSSEYYANPSSLHNLGMKAEKCIKEAKEIFAKALCVNANEIFFTSGGTESNNMSILGYALANKRKGKHIITTMVEHPSVLQPYKYLENQGFIVDYVEVDKSGIIDLAHFESLLREDTILVSVMHINNETGMIMPIEKLKPIMKKHSKNACLHIDAVQSFGKESIDIKNCEIDMLSASGHKIYAPRGVGLLYVKNGVRIEPIMYGGGQQQNLRSGTENTPAIASFANSFNECHTNIRANYEYVKSLKNRLLDGILMLEDVNVNTDISKSSPYILSVSFIDTKAEVLLHSLEAKGVYVSTGSACSSNKNSASHVLVAMGLPNKTIDSSIRFSLTHTNTIEEIDYTIKQLKEQVPLLRKYIRR